MRGGTGFELRFHAYIAGPGPGITDLGADVVYSRAYDINDSGQVTGSADFGTGTSRAFLWTRADGMRDIGTLGGLVSIGRAINGNGQIAGDSSVSANNNQIAFRYTPGVGIINLLRNKVAQGKVCHEKINDEPP